VRDLLRWKWDRNIARYLLALMGRMWSGYG
jgi:hypothetical protein